MTVGSHEQVSVPVEIDTAILMAVVKSTPQRDFPEDPPIQGIEGRDIIHASFGCRDGIVPTAGSGEDDTTFPGEHGHREDTVLIVFPKLSVRIALALLSLGARPSRSTQSPSCLEDETTT